MAISLVYCQASLNEAVGDLEGGSICWTKRVYVRTPLPAVRPIAAMKAHVGVRQGRLTKALRWADERDLSVDDELELHARVEHGHPDQITHRSI